MIALLKWASSCTFWEMFAIAQALGIVLGTLLALFLILKDMPIGALILLGE
jgi:hypothetical protein